MHACVVGAGIVGVHTALELQRELGGSARITLLADKFNEETTGDGAAGFIFPSTYFTGPTYEITRRWVRDSFRWYSEVGLSSEARAAGVAELPGYFFSDVSRDSVRNHLMEDVCPEYRDASEDELQLFPGGARFGAFARTLMVECRYFLPWALNRLQTSGATVERRRLETWKDLPSDYDVIFNCSGLGAARLCNDLTLVPVRGQVYKVHAPWIRTFTYYDRDTYVIPGREQVTLGGSRWLGNWSLEVDPHESAAIWEKCVRAVPSLRQARVLRQWVGLRPFRCPVRVELDNQTVFSDGRSTKIIHNYGHGGYGITSAPGTACHAVALFKNQLKASVSCKM